MNDIKNITDKILSDATVYAHEAETAAKQQAEQIMSSYREKAEKLLSDAKQKAAKDASDALLRAEAAHKMAERDRLLQAKCEIIDELFAQAASQLRQLSKQEYLELLTGFFKKACIPKDTVICMNRQDLDDEGKEFFAEANKIFKSDCPGCKLSLSEEPVKIYGGFILKNGDIEFNCSLESYLSDCREKHESDIFKLLFE